MLKQTINDKTVAYFCAACDFPYGQYKKGVKPYYQNSKTGEIEYCIKCGHRFGDNPWREVEKKS